MNCPVCALPDPQHVSLCPVIQPDAGAWLIVLDETVRYVELCTRLLTVLGAQPGLDPRYTAVLQAAQTAQRARVRDLVISRANKP